MGSSFYCNSVAVNNAVSDINSVISNLSLLSSDIKSATNQIVSATGFNEYIGGITNDTFSGYIEECGAAAYQLCNNIRQMLFCEFSQ